MEGRLQVVISKLVVILLVALSNLSCYSHNPQADAISETALLPQEDRLVSYLYINIVWPASLT